MKSRRLLRKKLFQKRMREWIFLQTLSVDTNLHQLLLVALFQEALLRLLVFLLSCWLLMYLALGREWILILFLLMVLGSLFPFLTRGKKTRKKLLEELNEFIFYYEVFLLRGENQYQALTQACERSGWMAFQEDVAGYVEAFNELYSLSHWMVMKKIVVLLERNQHFSLEDLSMDFLLVSRDLFDRYYRLSKLEMERREHQLLIPMTLNMLLMILYIVSPFILSFF